MNAACRATGMWGASLGMLVLGELILGCSASSGDTGEGGGGAGGGSAAKSSSGESSLSIGSGGSTGAGTGTEICDGIDNDGNGVLDDLDVGNDGVCDCLTIGTLGAPGPVAQSNVFATWLDSRSNNGAVELKDAVLTKELLAKFKVIVAEDVSSIGRSYDASEVAALGAWVEAGGGFMTLVVGSDAGEIANVNTLLGAFGMSYAAELILFGGFKTNPVTGWIAHPVSDGVTRLGIDNGRAVQGAGTVVATEQGFDVLAVQEVGSGHVVVWGDEWITYDSEWSAHPDYQVEHFWLNVIKWLSPVGDCQVPLPPS